MEANRMMSWGLVVAFTIMNWPRWSISAARALSEEAMNGSSSR